LEGNSYNRGPMTCPACGGSAWRARDVLARLVVRTCSACGLRASRIDADRSISYAQLEDTAYRSAIGRLRQRQASEIVKLARANVPRGAWLDIGCGPGYLLTEAANAGFSVRGIEPDPKAASLACERIGGDAVREGFFRESETPAVDVISTLDVLEHIELSDLPAFANDVRKSLRSGGVWVIKVPSTDGLYFRIAHALGLTRQIERVWQIGYRSPHTVYFAYSTLVRFLALNGFEVTARRYLQEMPLHTAVARLTMDGKTASWQAILAMPAIAMVNAIEWMRRKSDALVVIARPKPI
jgi:2-polyprenyl-3-methyl-5-hydroxy-6-metoxy-1,4-benzoquinol methylase